VTTYHPQALVLCPTRELCLQIADDLNDYSKYIDNLKVLPVYGGSSIESQIKTLKRGVHVVVATPGRLLDLMNRKTVDLSLVKNVIMDEADEMLNMGFTDSINAILAEVPENRNMLLFSATIDHSIQKNLGSLLNDPAVVEIARNGETAQTVEQFMMPIANFKKPELLQALLEEKGSDRVIVFARTKNRTEDCAEALCDAGYRAESIHSDKSQGQRKRALDNFRRGRTSILVATDVLARGIDVPDVDHVINFDLPDMPEDYVHRIGRTGRAGEQGFAVSFVTRESRRTMSDIEKLIGKNVPLMELETYELDMTVLENLKIGAYLRKDDLSEDLEWVYSLFPRLKERSWQAGGTLSGGEQQMLAVGRALMSRPKLLMMDEPSLGLAPLVVRDIFSIIQEINKQGVTILLIEQNANMALKIADIGYVLETGRITLTGSGEELLTNDAVRAAYLGA